jgi:hypothetical protein
MGTFAVLCIKYGIMPFVIHNMPNIELASRVAPGLP